jgi:predicted nuclease with TOPRIM domain
MKEKLEERLKELKAEFESGQKTLANLQSQEANLKETLLRISGAIQVLEEELEKAENDLSESEGTETKEAPGNIRSVG